MANEAPKVLYRNVFAEAHGGRGSGEVIAFGGDAVPDSATKTFNLGSATFNSEWAESDNSIRGMFIYFLDTGNRYLIVGFTSSASYADSITTFETPNDDDVGAWEVRRGLYTETFLNSNPVQFICNGNLYDRWKYEDYVSGGLWIDAMLPNGLDDGGFEDGEDPSDSAYDGPWETDLGATGTIALNGSSALLGGYNIVLNRGSESNIYMRQQGKIDLKKGRTYGFVMNCIGSSVGTVQSSIKADKFGSGFVSIGQNWTAIANSSAAASYLSCAVSTSEHWCRGTFTVDANISAGNWYWDVRVLSAGDYEFDEIYIYEHLETTAGAIQGTNMTGRQSIFRIDGYYCPSDRTGFSAGTDSDVDILGMDEPADGIYPDDPFFKDGSSAYPTDTFPIFRLLYYPETPDPEIAEFWAGPIWSWENFVSGDWEPYETDISVVSTTSFGGVTTTAERYRKKRRSGTVPYTSNAGAAEWAKFIDYAGAGEPFWYQMDALSDDFDLDEEVIFMRALSTPRIIASAHRIFSVRYDFEEVL